MSPIPARRQPRSTSSGGAVGAERDRTGSCAKSWASVAQSELWTPSETASWLHLSVKTLANWRSAPRSSPQGPPWVKVGGRVAYRRAAVMEWLSENESAGQQGRPSNVTVTVRPYPRDKARSQVDIMIQHPATSKIIRRRIVAPAGLDRSGAKAWGESQVPTILRELFVAQAKTSDKPQEMIETRQLAIETRKSEDQTPKQSRAPKIGELWDRYDEEILSNRNAKKTTAKTYRILWVKLCPTVKNIRCDRWDKDCTMKLAKSLATVGARYANQAAILLRHLFKIAISDGHVADVPKIPRRTPPRAKPQVVANYEDTERLLEAARRLEQKDGEAYPVMLLLGVDAGLRPGEVAGLRWSDIDWRRAQLMVQNQRPLPGPEEEETLPKYDEVGRVAMGPRLQRELEKLRARNGERGTYVLRTSKGEAMYTSLIADRIARIHREAGMPIRRGHHMRHVAASIIDDHPDSRVADVQAHLRHRNESTTATYLHAIRGSDRTLRVGRILEDLSRQTGNGLATHGNAAKTGDADDDSP